MLAFILPLKPRKESRDWVNDNNMLSQTLKSLLRQTDSTYKIYVVYTDEPSELMKHPNLEYLRFPYPFLEYEQVDAANPGEFLPNAKRLVERRFDKGRKIMFGCAQAREEGCTYLMAVDADDLVSDKLAAFVKENSMGGSVPGWYIPKGYVWKEGTNRLYRQFNMHLFNGSTHIIQTSKLPLPDMNSLHWQFFNWFVAHGWTRIRCKDKLGIELQPIPFYAVVYVVHDTNISSVGQVLSLGTLRAILKRMVLRKRITEKIRAEFGIVGSY